MLRMEQLYCELILKDEMKAEKYLQQFEKIATKYPYERNIESDRALIEIVDNKTGTNAITTP